MIRFKLSSLKKGDWNRLLKKSDKRTADYIKKKLPELSLQPSNNSLKRVKQQQQQQQTKLTAISN
jgi:hypothetical protein